MEVLGVMAPLSTISMTCLISSFLYKETRLDLGWCLCSRIFFRKLLSNFLNLVRVIIRMSKIVPALITLQIQRVLKLKKKSNSIIKGVAYSSISWLKLIRKGQSIHCYGRKRIKERSTLLILRDRQIPNSFTCCQVLTAIYHSVIWE